jgi:hypothetical protein
MSDEVTRMENEQNELELRPFMLDKRERAQLRLCLLLYLSSIAEPIVGFTPSTSFFWF